MEAFASISVSTLIIYSFLLIAFGFFGQKSFLLSILINNKMSSVLLISLSLFDDFIKRANIMPAHLFTLS
jgi:hypothetical protein